MDLDEGRFCVYLFMNERFLSHSIWLNVHAEKVLSVLKALHANMCEQRKNDFCC